MLHLMFRKALPQTLPMSLACLLLLAPPTFAQSTAATQTARSFDTWDTERLQSYTTGLLKEGRFYPYAIQAAQELIKRDPNAVQAHLMFASACAGRFASLGFALMQVDDDKFRHDRYQTKLKAWEKAQEDADPTAPQRRAPVPPPPLVTPDDGKPFTLTQEQARQQLLTLARDAVAAFQSARSMSETSTPEQKVQCELTRGWGLFLLRGGPNNVIQEGPVSKNTNHEKGENRPEKQPTVVYVSQSDVVDSFDRCVKLAPDNPQAWHSLALSLVPNRILAPANGRDTAAVKPSDIQAVEAIDKAVLLSPKDFDLLYQAAVLTTKVDASRSVAYLNRALKRQGTNAVAWYVLADRLFKQAEKQPDKAEALTQAGKDALKTGNSAPLFSPLTLTLPVPASLKAPWQYLPVYGQEQDGVLVQSLLAFLEKRVKQAKPGDETEGMTDAQLVMNLGLRQIGSVNPDTIRYADPITAGDASGRVIMGSVLCSYATGFLEKYPPTNPSQAYRDLLEQYVTLRKQVRTYQEEYHRDIE